MHPTCRQIKTVAKPCATRRGCSKRCYGQLVRMSPNRRCCVKHGKLCSTACVSVSCCGYAIRVQVTVFTVCLCACERIRHGFWVAGADASRAIRDGGSPGLPLHSGSRVSTTCPRWPCRYSCGGRGEGASRRFYGLTLCMCVGVADRALVDRVVVAVLLALGQHTLTSAWVVRHACIAIHTMATTGRLNSAPRHTIDLGAN